ncbi:MAG: arginine repressor [Oscillospiraceae bacterium]|jgi:transcriptional regulator of arginine metabolism|nr:arginine repressor [Oscillospiraceae bacterium]
MKERRHAKILELIGKYSIDTQEELLRRLREEGYEVTQATVSRDIKELRLIKSLTASGKYRYTVSQEESKDYTTKFYSLFSDSAVSVDYAQNMIAVKCMSGMANAVCAAMDTLQWDNIVGTLSGDDTIFILVKDESAAEQLTSELKKFVR